MKTLISIIAILGIIYSNLTVVYAGDVYVHGYTRSNGHYVMPSHRSAPDSNPYNNYNSGVVVNPYREVQVQPLALPAYEPVHIPVINPYTGNLE